MELMPFITIDYPMPGLNDHVLCPFNHQARVFALHQRTIDGGMQTVAYSAFCPVCKSVWREGEKIEPKGGDKNCSEEKVGMEEGKISQQRR